MEKIITNLDQQGRILIPFQIRKMFNLQIGNKVTLEIHNNELKIKNADYIIDEIHNIFIKNNDNANNITDDFLNDKKQEFELEQNRDNKYEQ